MTSPQSPSGSKAILNSPLRLLIIASSVFLFLFYGWSSNEARKTMSNRVIDWLPDGTEELQAFYRYYYHFPEGELLMVSWDGCTSTDERLDEIAERLTGFSAEGRPAFFERALTTRSVLAELMSDPLNLTRREAETRLAGWLIGRDGQQACLIALISPYGQSHRDEAIRAVFSVVSEITGLDRSKIYVAGPTIDSVAIDEISEYSQRTLLPFFLLFCLALLFCCLRNFFAACVIFAVALMNEELGGTLLYWTGSHVDSISMLISSLVFVLTISAGIHMINYYRETMLESGDPLTAPREMVRKAFLPCSLSMATTVLGLGSLMVSKMIPIRTFGMFASIALFLGTTWLFMILTLVLQQFPIRKWAKPVTEEPSEHAETVASAEEKANRWDAFASIIGRFRYSLAILSIAGMLFCAFGIKNLRTTVTFHGMLPESNKSIQDYAFLENTIGGLIPIEIVIHIPDEGNEKISRLNQMYFLETVRETLAPIEGIDAIVSALNFTADLPPQTERSFRAQARRSAINRLIESHTDRLKEARFFNRTEAGQDNGLTGELHGIFQTSDNFWRLSLRTSSKLTVDYDVLLGEIREKLESLRTTPQGMAIQHWNFDVTGGVPLVHRAQQQLLTDLIESFVTAFGLIALTMILMLRGVVRGLLAMIPNLFPCILVFGTLGWLDIPVDMGSMMTASVAMGIAVDGTLHYLTWFNIGLKQGRSRRDSVFYAYHCCATALTQTTIICGLGMLVFWWSDFIPVARFSLLMCVLLVTALIGDIVVLPAIMLTPLGRFFEQNFSLLSLITSRNKDNPNPHESPQENDR